MCMRKSEHGLGRATAASRATACRATARVTPTIHDCGEPGHPCIVGAGLAPALPRLAPALPRPARALLLVLPLLLVLTCSLLLFAAPAHAAAGTGRIYQDDRKHIGALAMPAHAAAGTGRIYGQLLDGTKHDAPVVGQSVTLQMAQGNNTRDLLNVTTDAHGEFC